MGELAQADAADAELLVHGTGAPAKGSVVRRLGVREPVHWERAGKGALLTLPRQAVASPPCLEAWVFKLKPARTGQGGGS